MPQVAENVAPGSSTTRSSPLLKASGGAVIGSTASAVRAARGPGRRRCTPAASRSARPPTARRRRRAGERSATRARPSASRTRSVKAWSSDGVADRPLLPEVVRRAGDRSRPVGSLRSSSVSSRVAPGRVEVVVVDLGRPGGEVGVRTAGERRGSVGQVRRGHRHGQPVVVERVAAGQVERPRVAGLRHQPVAQGDRCAARRRRARTTQRTRPWLALCRARLGQRELQPAPAKV